MKPEDHEDSIVDMLLWELVGEERPPDVRARVLEAVESASQSPGLGSSARPRIVPLRSAKPSNAPWMALAAVLILGAIAVEFVYSHQIMKARTPMLSRVEGDVSRELGPLRGGEEVKTGPDSMAVLVYQDGTVMRLTAETSLVVAERSRWDRSKVVEVVRGGAEAEVAPQPDGSPMVLRSKDAEAVVVGTQLSFRCDEAVTRLEVTEGTVRFEAGRDGSFALVKAGYFAEAGKDGFRTGPIESPPVYGITGFTLMNADTDQPIRAESLRDGEKILLSSLPTRNINIRADYEGDPPDAVNIRIRRHHGKPTGLNPHTSDTHEHPPFFVAGDHWAEGRSEDCAAWVAPPGFYHLSAEAIYSDEEKQALSVPLKIKFWIDR